MKTVYFIRHAKSSWSDMSLRDFDRPLNKRGTRDAPFMAAKLLEFGVKPDAIISSPANRAITTATHFAKALDILPTNILQKPEIYHAYATTILEVIQAQSNDVNTILIFGHNPGFTMIANMFKGGAHIDNVPTCGIVKVVAEKKKWSNFTPKNGMVKEFHFPKQYFD
ncbi:MAG: histidine phosphatase family protein [Saprospiraceae bacterium]